MKMKITLATALCGLTVGLLPVLASAQVTEPLLPVPPLQTGPQPPTAPGQPTLQGTTVTDRARPEVDPLGIPVGSFFFFPRTEIDEAYNDNIYATSSGTKGDFITTLMPSFDLLSNFPQNAINLRAGAALGEYASYSTEDFQDAFGSLDGRLDIDDSNDLIAGVRFDRLHEPRYSPNSPGNAAQPLVYNQYTGNVGAASHGLRLGYQADLVVQRSEFEAVPADGGGLITESENDENGYELALKGTYEFQPNYQVYVRGAGNTQQFDHAAGNGVGTRNSDGYRIDVGTHIDLTGVTFVDAYVGYLDQEFQSSQFGSIGGIDFGGIATWNATTLDTIKFSATRTVQNINQAAGFGLPGGTSAFANSPGFLQSIAGASIDHELLRDLLLNANFQYEQDAFAGISRTDNVYTAGAGVKYLLNRNLYLGLTYSLQTRDSTGSEAINGYTQNILMLRLSTQL